MRGGHLNHEAKPSGLKRTLSVQINHVVHERRAFKLRGEAEWFKVRLECTIKSLKAIV